MNRLYYGDNLSVRKGCIDDESVDLIYLDPPFNSQATYNVLFKSTAGEKSRAQIEAFEDTWHWGDEAELAFNGVINSGNSDATEMLRAMRLFLRENDMMTYLSMMAVRLLELHPCPQTDGEPIPALRPRGQPLPKDFARRSLRSVSVSQRSHLASHQLT